MLPEFAGIYTKSSFTQRDFVMDHPVFVVPGIGNSGSSHWQSLWQASNPSWRRLEVDDWDYVVCNDWVSAIERQLAAADKETVLVAHSLGCLAVAHWAARYKKKIRGALLVAVPDPESPAFPRAATSGFAPLPPTRLPFSTTVVASTNDPYGSVNHARACAAAWGSEFVEVGAKGHINSESNLGDWPEGFRLLQKMNNG
jgi:predicted alpha/beta hydrolase family esterase